MRKRIKPANCERRKLRKQYYTYVHLQSNIKLPTVMIRRRFCRHCSARTSLYIFMCYVIIILRAAVFSYCFYPDYRQKKKRNRIINTVRYSFSSRTVDFTGRLIEPAPRLVLRRSWSWTSSCTTLNPRHSYDCSTLTRVRKKKKNPKYPM